MSLAALADIAASRSLPCALVDLAAFDRNCAHVARLAGTKRVRIATKSIRVLALIERVLKRGAPFHGVMAYDPREAERLAQRGVRDLLVAYPCMDEIALAALKRAHESGAVVSQMIDGSENEHALSRAMLGVRDAFPAIIDVDMSLRRANGRVHLGVRRSPVRTVDDVLARVDGIRARDNLRFGGLMGYEAQVAGLGDANAKRGTLSLRTRAMDAGKRAVRRASVSDGRARRGAIAAALAAKGVSIEVFNGGGSGSLDTTSAEPWITEVTAGSALYAPHLFDHFTNVKYEPSLYFALRVTRASDTGATEGGARFVTCAGGGYIASGAPGWDKVPLPVWPRGLSLVENEGCGEVQTPLAIERGGDAERANLKAGDVVLFRHAKAGELFERIPTVLLVDDAASARAHVVDEVPSYRGMGWSFA